MALGSICCCCGQSMFGRVDTANPNVCIACAHLLEDGAPIEQESSADPDIPVIVPTTLSADERDRFRHGVTSVPYKN